MNPHLSHEQFGRCFVGISAGAELRHVSECSPCRAELEAFGKTVSSLRQALHGHVDHAVALPRPLRRLEAAPRFRIALAAAAVLLLGLLPLLTPSPTGTAKESAASSPEALMDAINVHLSRTVPSPMEPMMSLLPSNNTVFVLGGIR